MTDFDLQVLKLGIGEAGLSQSVLPLGPPRCAKAGL
jgi:hypothetical protein